MAVKPAPVLTANKLQADSGQESILQRVSTAVDLALFRAFEGLGARVATRPRTTIAAVVAFSVVCALGLINFRLEQNAEKLYTPPRSEAWDDRRFVEAMFGFGTLRSEIYALPRAGPSFLTQETLLATFDLVDFIRTIRAKCVRGSCAGTDVSFDDVAVAVGGNFDISSVLDFVQRDRAAVQSMSDAQIAAAASASGVTNAIGKPVKVDAVLGGVSRNSGGAVTGARAGLIVVVLRNNKEAISGLADEDPAASAWSRELSAQLRQRNVSDTRLSLFPIDTPTEDEVQDSAIGADVALISFGYMLLIVYSCVVLARASWVRSQANLAFFSVLAVCLSIVSTFGILAAVGVPFNLVTQSLSLLLLSLGLDDTYVIVDAYATTSKARGIPWRVGRALGRAGSSIALTSFTDLVAFAAGSSSTLPALRDFCYYAAVGIVLDFAFQVTFFVAFLALDQQRIDAGKADLLPCVRVPEETPFFKLPCLSVTLTGPSLSHRVAGIWLPKVVLHPVGKAVVLIIAAAIVGGGAYGTSQLEMDFSREWFTPDNSWLKQAYSVRDAYFAGQNIPFGVYTKQIDYFEHFGAVRTLEGRVGDNKWVQPGTVLGWGSGFSTFIASTKANSDINSANGGPLRQADFYPWLREFLDSPQGRPYRSFLRFSDDTRSHLLATEIFAQLIHVPLAPSAIEATKALRAIAGEFPQLGARAYTFPMLFWDGLDVITAETVRNVLIALACVGVVSLILLADARAALIVLFTIAAIDVALLGAMWILDLSYNMVTAINLVLAIGIAVDYSAHICHSFLVSVGTKDERAALALEHIGGAVLNGAISTFFGVAMLGFSQSYIFQVFFAMWSLIVLLAAFFGLCVMPVMLSFVGPDAVASAHNHTPTPFPAKVNPEATIATPGTKPASTLSTQGPQVELANAQAPVGHAVPHGTATDR